jgi:DNA-binding PadR family transcriptional regulator
MTRRVGNKGSGAMRSQVNHAVLGLVIARPSYGYELGLRFERLYGDVLPVSGESHIYKALNALQSNSMIIGSPGRSPASPGTDRQPKVHYSSTDTGREWHRAQLVEQMRDARRRSQLLVRQLAVYASEPQMALDVIDRIEEACLDAAVGAPMAPKSVGSGVGGDSGLVALLASEESRLAMEAKLPWIEYARRAFKMLAEDAGRVK